MHIDEAFYQDPFPFLARCREIGALKVGMPDGTTPWLLTRYDDVVAALNHPALSSQITPSGMMNHTDPPDHTRLRKLVMRGFSAKQTKALRPRIQQIADELLDDWVGAPVVDVIDTFAFPLPIRVIGELLGVPDEDHPWLRELTSALMRPEDMVTGYSSLVEYVGELVVRKQPGDDLITALLDDEQLARHELISMLILLIVAGHETTVQLIGNGILALLRDPAKFAELKANPEDVPIAVEELLRFDGPINPGVLRLAVDDVVIGGAEMAAGDFVLVSLASANRDPSRFKNPDVLSFDRGRHLAFGHGIHHCLGAWLARLEGEIAFATLLRRYPDIELATEEFTWKVSVTRGLTALPVRPKP
ncbi:cytochrome P450 [Lentzea tibetensis]|uniref:Cytochrome P450 n=1 Tax=Lentzea tibetensis TaxID=2591470 RepID=A0A563EYD2_9PSEU|nr:cytochrome P450 [Lentzea tibetensis]TWP52552.1 cytochrome P450 [Lentzea tibetensis]